VIEASMAFTMLEHLMPGRQFHVCDLPAKGFERRAPNV
jgi:hypothetical protein